MSNTSDLLDGTSQVLAAAGIGDYPWTGGTLVNGAAITWKSMPADPDRVICLTPFGATADQPLITYGRWALQLWFRGTTDPRDVDELGDAAFAVLHGLSDRMFGGVHVAQILRESSIPRGMDEQARRHTRSDNYLFDVDYPTSPLRPI